MLRIYFILSTLCIAGQSYSQDILTDSIDYSQQPKKTKDFKGPLSMFSGNPGRAALYSLILPSAGQFYNKKYWKVPLVLAAEGTAIGFLVYNTRIYNEWNEALLQISANPQIITEYKGRNTAEVRDKRDSARQFRDYTIVAVAAVHLIQVADAFVNRHLIEFDVSDDLSLDLRVEDQGPSLGFTFNF